MSLYWTNYLRPTRRKDEVRCPSVKAKLNKVLKFSRCRKAVTALSASYLGRLTRTKREVKYPSQINYYLVTGWLSSLVTTVLFSDLHFGYERFNRTEFEGFLTYLEKSNASKLLILGDIFDLWRADPIDSVSYAWHYIEKLRSLNIETHYIIGNHDYHNWLSCQTVGRSDSFLWMKISYPYQVFDSLFVIHGDYFDIYSLKVESVQKAIYAVYEAIYHGDKTIVRALEKYFYDPLTLLSKWIQLYHKNPELAKAHPVAAYLKPLMNIDSKQEVRKLENGVRYLRRNSDLGMQLLVPAYSRPALGTDMPRLLARPMTKKARVTLRNLDTSAPTRNLVTSKTPFELAKEISPQDNITAVIFGHTHRAENKASQHWWNTGCWVEGESTFVEIENGTAHLYRFENGTKTEIPE
jgi:UDP-2,3-diacylglucosamine pyrophosphatase LpxH